MDTEALAVLGFIFFIVFVATILTIPGFVHNEPLTKLKHLYETYVDVFAVALSAAIAVFAIGIGLGMISAGATMKDIYIFFAILLLAIRTTLAFIDLLSGTHRWLINSVAHLFDLAIVIVLLLALRE